MDSRLKRWVIIAMLLAMAIVVSYVESFIPVFIPGVKLGLANAIILIMLFEFKWYEAFVVDIFRILIVALIRGTFLAPAFLLSLSGGMLSFFIMFIFSRIKLFSPIGISVLGSIGHPLGQILMAIIILSSQEILYYLPFTLGLSVLTGILSGMVVRVYLKRSITSKFVN